MNILQNLKKIENLAKKNSIIHELSPISKLITTIVFLIVVMSFDKYQLSNLLPFITYPVITAIIADIPLKTIIKYLFLIEPLIIGIAILNPVFDNHIFSINGMLISSGWISFIAIVLKGSLAITSALLLISTTDFYEIALSLRFFGIPKIFIFQLLLTYRYIHVLIEEVSRMMLAHSLRSPYKKGIKINMWGSFAGQLLLRTIDRSNQIYSAMKLRGFNGDMEIKHRKKSSIYDYLYLFIWIVFFITARVYNIPVILGKIFFWE